MYQELEQLFCIKDWDRFVHSAIRLWEELYLKWLVRDTKILILYYEDLKDTKLRRKALRDVSNFLDFESDEERLECVLKHPYTKFQRAEKKCFHDKLSINKFGVDSCNSNTDSLTHIFQTNHKTWIDRAITKVHRAMVKRFRLPSNNSSLLNYKNSVVKINICQMLGVK